VKSLTLGRIRFLQALALRVRCATSVTVLSDKIES
jgi:hypothetical protein